MDCVACSSLASRSLKFMATVDLLAALPFSCPWPECYEDEAICQQTPVFISQCPEQPSVYGHRLVLIHWPSDTEEEGGREAEMEKHMNVIIVVFMTLERAFKNANKKKTPICHMVIYHSLSIREYDKGKVVYVMLFFFFF